MKKIYILFTILSTFFVHNIAIAQSLSDDDKKKIEGSARVKLKMLYQSLNLLTEEDLQEDKKDSIIINSARIGSNKRFFYDENVIIEDDIDPRHHSAQDAVDVKYDRYLNDIVLLYSKTSEWDSNPLIVFQPGNPIGNFTPVQKQGDILYIKAFFRCTFKGKHEQIKLDYKTTNRVAEFRVEKNPKTKRWESFIIRLAFERPGEGMELVKKNSSNQLDLSKTNTNGRPKIPVDLKIGGPVVTFRESGNNNNAELKFNKLWIEVTQSSSIDMPIGFYQRQGNIYAFDDQNSIEFQDNNNKFIFHKGTIDTGYERIMPVSSKPAIEQITPALTSEPKPTTLVGGNTQLSKTTSETARTGQTIANSPASAKVNSKPDTKSDTTGRSSFTQNNYEKPNLEKLNKPIVAKNDSPKSVSTVTSSLSANAKKEKARLKTMGWIQVIGGLAGLAGSYIGYSAITKDYNAYKSEVSRLNSEYNTWREVARNPTGSELTLVSITGYGKPGVYGVYGGGVLSLGLVISGVRSIVRSGKIREKK